MNGPQVSLYRAVAQNGKPIGSYTQVTFPDGVVVKFMARMSKREAIAQARAQR